MWCGLFLPQIDELALTLLATIGCKETKNFLFFALLQYFVFRQKNGKRKTKNEFSSFFDYLFLAF